MGTLVYAPAIMVTIATQNRGIIDVSDDISNANIALRTGSDGGHQLSLTLTNIRRKYDGVFTPNDRIVVHLKRIRWVQVMSGYLNSVPAYTVYSGSVKLSASCTIKRLFYSLYDRGSQSVVNLLNSRNTVSSVQDSADSELALKARDVLEHIAGWEPDKIHIGKVPVDWFGKIWGLYESLKEDFDPPAHLSGAIAGESLAALGLRRVPNPASTGTDDMYEQGPGYGYLPTYSARAIRQDTIADADRLRQPSTPYHCVMRWGYRSDLPGQGSPLSAAERRTAEQWWAKRRILIANPATQKVIIAQPVGWGPVNRSDAEIGLSPEAFNELGLTAGARVDVRFAKEGEPFGVVPPEQIQTRLQGAQQFAGDIASRLGGLFTNKSNADASAVPSSVVTHEGITFTAKGNDKPHVHAARQFIEKNWPKPPEYPEWSIGGWRPSSALSTSLHHKGLALDVMITRGGEPSDQEVALGNQIAYWFCQNPDAFGVTQVIWNNMIYQRSGAKVYTSKAYNVKEVNGGHRNHIHLSFTEGVRTSIGPMGNPFPVTPSDFMASAAIGGVVHQNRSSSISSPGNVNLDFASLPLNLVKAWNYFDRGDAMSNTLVGPRLLLNDEPVQPLVDQLFSSAQREWSSAPNGDIIAWWPDYFNFYSTASRLVVQTVELESFNIQWSDKSLITHQFVTGAVSVGLKAATAGAEMASRRAYTHGIATVEFPELLEALINAEPGSPWLNPDAILQRFGARVNHQALDWLSSPEAEFWYAVHKFMKSWASQFSTVVPLAFMPELFPGMILQIPYYGLQMYVAAVEHTVDLGPNGGGFSTNATCVCPSTIGEQPGLYGLPRGGGWIGSEQRGPAFGPQLTPPDPSASPEANPGRSTNRLNPGG